MGNLQLDNVLHQFNMSQQAFFVQQTFVWILGSLNKHLVAGISGLILTNLWQFRVVSISHKVLLIVSRPILIPIPFLDGFEVAKLAIQSASFWKCKFNQFQKWLNVPATQSFTMSVSIRTYCRPIQQKQKKARTVKMTNRAWDWTNWPNVNK